VRALPVLPESFRACLTCVRMNEDLEHRLVYLIQAVVDIDVEHVLVDAWIVGDRSLVSTSAPLHLRFASAPSSGSGD
jgi:hypothetical protein